MTDQEIQAVKDSGKCHDIDLVWKVEGFGIDGKNVEKSAARCSVCLTKFTKAYEPPDEEPPPEPPIIDLDQV